jgi:ferric-dicitrate binding protein FerR (iron transport regulator)
MAKSKRNLNMRDPEITTFFNELPDPERREMLSLWNETGDEYRDATANDRAQIDTEAALRNVQQQLGMSPESGEEQLSTAEITGQKRAGERISVLRPFMMYALIAATLLISAGIFWATQPVRTTVPAGEMLSLTLPDGSEVMLNSGSELHHNRLFGYTNRDIELNGEAYFDVQRSDIPFRVEANGSLTEVLGTSFNVRSWDSDPALQTSLTVTSGRVAFQRAEAKASRVILTKGFSSELQNGMTAPSEPVSTDVDQALAWTQHQLAFAVQPLSVIFAELERKFDIEIQWNDPRIGRSTLTSFYNEPESAESVLNDICTVKGLSYTRTSTGYRIHF